MNESLERTYQQAEMHYGAHKKYWRNVFGPPILLVLLVLSIYGVHFASKGISTGTIITVLYSIPAVMLYFGYSLSNLLSHGGPLAHFRNYWNHNVKGYTLWCYLRSHDYQSPNRGVGILVCPRGKVPSPEHIVDDRIYILFPAGGWFNKPSLRRCMKDDDEHLYLSSDIHWSWNVRRDAMLGRKRRRPGVISDAIQLGSTNPKNPGWSFFTIRNALEFIAETYGHPTSLGFYWFDVKRERERKAEQHKQELTEARDAHIRSLKRYIDALWQTSRFGNSKEGAAIRRQMQAELMELLPEDDPSREEYSGDRRPARLAI